MIGVILWSDADDHKAVIWCEDQGDLAFLSEPDSIHLPDAFFEVGELVEFDVSTRRNLRLAHNTSRLGHSCGTALADDLQSVARPRTRSDNQAKILPFRLDTSRRPTPPPQPVQRRRG
ncbi:hypothetical protein [uncultured Tateyamaria sp.]|uniref:hypothetical protein n=1 Tax=uncultured Tateyamaria sp. TaxID=455651 RepID=UPI002605A418|nr:hypothetical protein [uncultured Tateyamaria sp.]